MSEQSMTDLSQNPLLDTNGLPRFDVIRPEHVGPAIDHLIEAGRKAISHAEQAESGYSWAGFVEPLGESHEKLGRAWGIVSHLNGVVDTPELRAAYNEALPKVTEFWTDMGQNLALFNKYKQLRASEEFKGLSGARKKIIENELRDFRLGGAELPEAEKQRYAEIQEQLSALTTRFSENVLDATNDFALYIEDASELKGLPDDFMHAARAAAEADGKPGYKLTLHFPSYFPVLQFAESRQLRETVYRANTTKASELSGKPEWDNTEKIEQILALRDEEAKLLGYDSYADVSLVSKMAESPAQVEEFLRDLGKRARPHAERDLQEVREFAKSRFGLETCEAWDLSFVSEKLREERYAFSEQEVKQYFPEDKVIAGLFETVEKLFGVKILPDSASVWHRDVQFYRLERDGKLIAQFYLDPYARSGKRSGAWMDDARGRKQTSSGIQTPVAYLVCNFSQPNVVNGVRQPSLLTHDDVITLFHEFGHGLHHMLTEVDELSVSGINGVEWDAVELPSQFMENFTWEWEVLNRMTRHVETGETLPRALYDKMLAAKNFQAGLQTLRQVEFALTDIRLHGIRTPDTPKAQTLLAQVRDEIAVVIPPDFNRFLHSFSHIFAGGYAAGYYSYKWAEVLSADAYAALEEGRTDQHGILLAPAGHDFQREILAIGGSRPALESFIAFRGREPNIDALLRHNGMNA